MNKITSELRDFIQKLEPGDFDKAQCLMELSTPGQYTFKEAIEAVIASRDPRMVVFVGDV